ncbi:hypothetical protein L7F22_042735 [Adiantum nelumboides]|nr:hypothetical protein [Adiantum nelumboides]
MVGALSVSGCNLLLRQKSNGEAASRNIWLEVSSGCSGPVQVTWRKCSKDQDGSNEGATQYFQESTRRVCKEAQAAMLHTLCSQGIVVRGSSYICNKMKILNYVNDIKKNPVFRAQFHAMCATCGVDPLASNKGFWAELLGIGDFYYELGVQIVDICLATRSYNGGLIDLEELCSLLSKKRRALREPISEDDCRRAISKLEVKVTF